MPHRGKLSRCAVLAVVVALSGAALAGDAGREVLSNADIVTLVRAGLAPQLVMDKISHTPNTFDMSTRAIIAMKENGVPDDVIRAMMAAAAGPSARPGLDSARFGREMDNIVAGPPSVRSTAVAWLLAHQAETLPEVRRSLNNSRPEIRSAALLVIERAGDGQSVPAVRNLLTDGSPEVRADAARVLAALGDEQSAAGAEQAVAMQLSPLDGYIRLVGHARRTQAAEALGRVVSSNPDPRNRAAAAWALGEIGRAGVAGRPALEKALADDADAGVRREAALAVAKYRDSAAADLLQDACRTDPEVRRTTLAAMADYPETVEFLVGVLNLGPDQIAADELETARASLARLSGQDFGLDGQRWNEWFAANRTRYASAQPTRMEALAPLASAPAVAPLQAFPGRPPAKDVDVDKWGIVADVSGIPMAPMVDGMGGAPGGSSLAGPPPAPIFGGGPLASPGASVASGTAAGLGPAGARGEAAIPFDIPEVDPMGGMIMDSQASAPEQPVLRTWSSDPDRIPPAPGSTPARSPSASPAAPGRAMATTPSLDLPADATPLPSGWAEAPVVETPSSGWSEAPVAQEPTGWVEAPRPAPAAPPPAPAQPAQPTPAASTASATSGSMLPAAPIVAPPSSSGQTTSYEPTGISLPLPGMASSAPSPEPAPAAPVVPAAPPVVPPGLAESPSFEAAPDMGGDSPFAAPESSGASLAPPALAESPVPPPAEMPESPAEQGADEEVIFSGVPDESFFAAPPADVSDVPDAPEAGLGLPVPPPPGAGLTPPGQGVSDESAALPPPPAETAAVAGESEGLPPPPSYPVTAAPSHAPSFTGPVFVEPEPGQVVVGDALFPDGVPDEDAPATTYEYRTEAPTASEGPVAPVPAGAAPAGAYVPYPVPSAPGEGEEGIVSEEILVPDGFILGADGVLYEIVDDPSEVEGYVPPPVAAPSARRSLPPPPDAPPASAPPPPPPATAAPVAPPPAAAPIAPPPASDAVFTDPSAPLPPVREEGTVRPAPGKSQPPMLGEGMF